MKKHGVIQFITVRKKPKKEYKINIYVNDVLEETKEEKGFINQKITLEPKVIEFHYIDTKIKTYNYSFRK